MRGWGIEERGQSDVSAYSRAKERIVTLLITCLYSLRIMKNITPVIGKHNLVVYAVLASLA